MIIDTHAHYDDEAFSEDREAVFDEIKKAGVGLVVNIGSSFEAAQESVRLSEKYDFIYAAVGIHPTETVGTTEEHMAWLLEASKSEKVVAIGEIGLDYYYDEPDREFQKQWFRRQIELAREAGLPICIHSREAAKDTLDIIKEQRAEEIGGVIHCYSYGWEQAKIYLEMGFYLGIGGVVTFKNAKKLKEVVKNAPIERLVLETDAPYLAPVPYRGKRNHSGNLPLVAEAVAKLKELSTGEVIRITEENARRLYPKLR